MHLDIEVIFALEAKFLSQRDAYLMPETHN